MSDTWPSLAAPTRFRRSGREPWWDREELSSSRSSLRWHAHEAGAERLPDSLGDICAGAGGEVAVPGVQGGNGVLPGGQGVDGQGGLSTGVQRHRGTCVGPVDAELDGARPGTGPERDRGDRRGEDNGGAPCGR